MNKNLQIITSTLLMTAFISGMSAFTNSETSANSTGAPATRTGSPGDTKSCTTCHAGTAQNAIGIMSSNIPVTGYVPGSTYMINAVCTDATKNRFGFEISPQNIAGAKLGVLTVTDITRTKLVGSGKYITHTSAGTTGTGTISWSFNWTAPAAGTGDVTFYGAFNFSNHNNATSGDLIKLSQFTVSEDLFTGIENISASAQINIYPNPVSDIARIVMPSSIKPETIRIFALDGKVVRTFENLPTNENFEMNVATLAAGTYYVSLETENGFYSSKLIKL
jgi:hypothetical protein